MIGREDFPARWPNLLEVSAGSLDIILKWFLSRVLNRCSLFLKIRTDVKKGKTELCCEVSHPPKKHVYSSFKVMLL